ncbi:IPT/TIG domain-containing protein, partial [Streptomyces sp. NPDC059474]
DTTTNTVVGAPIPVGTQPNFVAIAPNGNAYVANIASSDVTVIDTTTNTVLVPSIPVGSGPWGITVGPNGIAYTADLGANNVTVIDTTTNTVVGAPIPVGTQPIDVAVAPNGKVYVANFGSNNVSVFPGAPTLTGISPDQGATTGGTVVTITGTNLTGAGVTIGGNPATNVIVNATGTQITATTPPGAAGPATVTVTTPSGTASLVNGFTYLPDATSLSATPALEKLFPPQVFYPFLNATLVDLVTGLPVPGQTITFSTGNRILGTAITNAQGTARLSELFTFPLILVNGGYTAAFAGTSDLLPSTAHAGVIIP